MTLFKKILIFSALSLIIVSGENLLSLPDSSFYLPVTGSRSAVYSSVTSVYKIESSDEDFNLSPSSNQKILSSQSLNGIKTVTISSGDYPVKGQGDNSKFLKNTPYLNIDNKNIKRTASRFKNSKDPVFDVSLFVYRHIIDKKTGIPLLPATAILTDRAGDCTEHSILTVSLLRALNIPSRAIVGIILTENFNGKNDVFVYHMWVEALQNGRWVLVDSTRPQYLKHNRYIALARHNLTTETPLEYLQAISTIQDIKISIIK